MKDSDAGEGDVKSRDELDVWVPAAVQGKNYTKEIPSLFVDCLRRKFNSFEPRHRHQSRSSTWKCCQSVPLQPAANSDRIQLQ